MATPHSAQVAEKIVDKGDQGYDKALKRRHIQMIAIGGSIGTGLFLGAGGRIADGGPALALSYAICGVFAFIMVRALGELSIRRPSSGAFVSYAREFMGEKGAFVTGWLFFLDWSTTVMADITAVALYLHHWRFFQPIPQWSLAMTALALVFVLNMLSVKFFGEAEFWFAAIKVTAIVTFMVVAIWAILTGHAVANDTIPDAQAGFSNWTNYGGFFPAGVGAMLMLTLGVVFAFGGTEMVGVAAGEAKNAREILPKAVNSMILRIFVFYVGSVILMTLVLPWRAYSKNKSPFVTFFSGIGVPHAGDIMQVVVLTAALSSLNAGLYATGRTLRSMAIAGEAPHFAGRLNRHKVPYGGIIITAVLGLFGVALNLIVPENAFSIVMNLAGIGIAGTWMSILVTHWIFIRRAAQGLDTRPEYRLFGAPYTNAATIIFLLVVIVSMAFDVNNGGPWTLALFGLICLAMVIGWYSVRDRIRADKLDEIAIEEPADLASGENS